MALLSVGAATPAAGGGRPQTPVASASASVAVPHSAELTAGLADHHVPGGDGAVRLRGLSGLDLAQTNLQWAEGSDVIVTSEASSSGFRIFVGKEQEKYAFRGLATLQPGGDDQDEWIGHQCLTGNGRHVLAVVTQRHLINDPEVRDRGGLAYSIDVKTGRVAALLSLDPPSILV